MLSYLCFNNERSVSISSHTGSFCMWKLRINLRSSSSVKNNQGPQFVPSTFVFAMQLQTKKIHGKKGEKKKKKEENKTKQAQKRNISYFVTPVLFSWVSRGQGPLSHSVQQNEKYPARSILHLETLKRCFQCVFYMSYAWFHNLEPY